MIIREVLAGVALMLAASPSLSAGPPPHGGTVYVNAATAPNGDETAARMSINAASTALGAKGFTFLDDPDHAAYVADIVVSRTNVGTGQERVSAGAATMMGAGVSVPFSTGQSRLIPLERTEVEIRIRRRGDPAVLWHGAAVTVRAAGARAAAADTVVSTLSAAALRPYPVQSAEVVGVP